MALRPRASGAQREKKSRLGLWAGLAIVILALAYAGVLLSSQPHVAGEGISFSTFVELAESGKIRDAKILDVDSYVVGTFVRSDGTSARYNTPFLKDTRQDLLELVLRARVPTTIDQQNGKRAIALSSTLIPALIVVVLFLYLVVSYQRGSGLFGVRSGALRAKSDERSITFADVAGQDAAVAELKEVTAFLCDPGRFAGLGAAAPTGILLFGPPGCGKTLLARAVAGESSAAFFSISGSDFVELYAGVGAARVRDLFEKAREAAPAIVFVDELDALGRARGPVGPGGQAREQDQTLNQLLAEMDGFSSRDGIVVLAATNRPDVLDPALLRPGRFDRTIGLERPGETARRDILELHARSKPMELAVDLGAIARSALGMSGADLAGLLNEAALLAARAGKTTIGQGELEEALTRLLQAPERQRRLALRERGIGRRFTGEGRVTFADVAGVDDAIEELAEVRDYLAEPDRFRAVGARTPRGILLSGPPGCGKTLLARAVAGEANAAFFSVAATEFATPYAGSGAARIRDLFAEARSAAPAIVFVDEIDAVGGRRTLLSAAVDSERDSILNQLLSELDGFEPSSDVLVMAASNRADLLDPALVRPGRFDRHVTVSLPDRAGRLAILQLHSRGKPLAPDVDLGAVAGFTQGLSGADLANVLNEAALLTARRGLAAITPSVLDEAFERSALGIASRGTILDDQERRLVAFHEAGHALVALELRGAEGLHKLSIAPRGGTLGRCTLVDSFDRTVQSRSRLHGQLAIGLGGRAAEALVFGETASASASDLRAVGDLARRMVRELGMSEAAGPLAYAGDGGEDWHPSEEARRLVDSEARRLAEEASAEASAVLSAHRAQLERVAEALLERESLSVGELVQLVGTTPLADRKRLRETADGGKFGGPISGDGTNLR